MSASGTGNGQNGHNGHNSSNGSCPGDGLPPEYTRGGIIYNARRSPLELTDEEIEGLLVFALVDEYIRQIQADSYGRPYTVREAEVLAKLRLQREYMLMIYVVGQVGMDFMNATQQHDW